MFGKHWYRGGVLPKCMILALGTVLAWGFLTAAKPNLDRPLTRIDRMWLAGEPALDDQPKPGIYVWIDKKNFVFAAVADPLKTSRVYQWTITGAQGLRLLPGGDCKIAARDRKGIVLAARPRASVARCALSTKGEIRLSRFKTAGRPARMYVGPMGYSAARSIRIGRY